MFLIYNKICYNYYVKCLDNIMKWIFVSLIYLDNSIIYLVFLKDVNLSR